jgi:hypothetical protein
MEAAADAVESGAWVTRQLSFEAMVEQFGYRLAPTPPTRRTRSVDRLGVERARRGAARRDGAADLARRKIEPRVV